MVLPEVRSQLPGCYLNAFSKWLLGAGSKWSMVSALELREPVVFPLCSGYSEVCLWPFITSICSWNLLVCFLAWDLKCRPQRDILSRIYQVEFIGTIGRWLSPVPPNWRCCYISLSTEQREKVKPPGSPWMLSYLRELERKGIGPKLLMSEQALLCWGSSWRRALPLLGLCHHHGMAWYDSTVLWVDGRVPWWFIKVQTPGPTPGDVIPERGLGICLCLLTSSFIH